MSAELVGSDRAPGLLVAPGVEIPADAEIAPHVTIYGGVELGSGVSLEQGAILGRRQQVDARSRAPRQPEGATTVIGAGCRVGSGTTVCAGARIGAESYLADQVLIRETATIGEQVMVGRTCTIHHNTEIKARVRIYALTIVGPSTTIEEDVHVSPYVMFVGDPTMGRRPYDASAGRMVVRRGARIGTRATIIPPAEIGEEAVVGAGALVRGDVEPRTVVTGAPAEPRRSVREDELLEAWRD
jgi:acetyltransferase-like isoleucine patch superfamily enzyme